MQMAHISHALNRINWIQLIIFEKEKNNIIVTNFGITVKMKINVSSINPKMQGTIRVRI